MTILLVLIITLTINKSFKILTGDKISLKSDQEIITFRFQKYWLAVASITIEIQNHMLKHRNVQPTFTRYYYYHTHNNISSRKNHQQESRCNKILTGGICFLKPNYLTTKYFFKHKIIRQNFTW